MTTTPMVIKVSAESILDASETCSGSTKVGITAEPTTATTNAANHKSAAVRPKITSAASGMMRRLAAFKRESLRPPSSVVV